MSDQMVKLIITGALAVHGLGHGGAVAALAWIGVRPGTDTGGWHAAQSWLLPGLSAGTAASVASVIWIASLVGFVAAALGFSGILVPGEAWRPLAAITAVVSMVGIVLFIGTWPAFNTVAALGMNVAVLVALLGMRWPPETMFGK
jgi:hypothetical protein